MVTSVLTTAVHVVILLLLIAGLAWMQVRRLSFSARVFSGLGLGILFGIVLHQVYGPGSEVLKSSIDWFNLVGVGYVKLLQMIVIPLVFISIVAAFTKMELTQNVGKVSGLILLVLVGTTAIAAAVGIASAGAFDLQAVQIPQGNAELAQAARLEQTFATIEGRTLPQQILELIPANPFLDFTGARRSSTLAVVIFAAFVGLAYLGVRRRDPQAAETFERLVQALNGVVMGMVRIVIRLTPYGVLALMTRVAATSDYAAIWQLGKFVVASYAALLVMFGIHLLLLTLAGLNPAAYVRKVLPVLGFAFTSRSSAATLPLNVRAQTEELGVPQGIANFAGSLGLSIGQNGCAGIYPAMLAVMIAPTVGIDPFTPSFLATVIAVVAISSFGVAGVGGGATFAAILVLSVLGLPVGLAGLLISIEPLIDMGRTAVNVSGAMTAGVLTSRLTRQLNAETYVGVGLREQA
ncbi:L-cystine transporter tcyP [Limnochorda pilosa]|uniref:L-cystine uptake protein TcyP n=1 Tax=Limnochorda pilosa TaxID=1555112 RepID=A0A0K2SLE1_LIMPI|nr:L-cystine transporter tcyP [Limnochorda pilosa]